MIVNVKVNSINYVYYRLHGNDDDIFSSALCLEYVGLTKEQYMEGVARVARLLKPGGILVMQAHGNVHFWIHAGRVLSRIPFRGSSGENA